MSTTEPHDEKKMVGKIGLVVRILFNQWSLSQKSIKLTFQMQTLSLDVCAVSKQHIHLTQAHC